MNNILGKLDLNLLITLDVLLDECNVSRAAQKLNLSQPSVSVQLAKIRDALGDPVLLPGPRGMQPTIRAETLREPLKIALKSIEYAIAPPQPFDPITATQTWYIAAADYAEMAIMMPLFPKLRLAAPKTRLAIVEMVPANISKLTPHIDLTLHIQTEAPPEMKHKRLFKEHYVLTGRLGHPLLKRKPSIKQFCNMEHVIVSPDGRGFYGPTDQALEKLGLKRNIVLSVPHFLFVISVLQNTDLVALLPARLVCHPLFSNVLQTTSSPVEIHGFEMTMLWHERMHHDPAHQWLRQFIVNHL